MRQKNKERRGTYTSLLEPGLGLLHQQQFHNHALLLQEKQNGVMPVNPPRVHSSE
jgi:hypothetical protein